MSGFDRKSWRRVRAEMRGLLLTAACVLAFAGVALFTALAIRAAYDNRTISALAANHDRPVSASARFEVRFARADFLLRHDRLDEAQAWVDETGVFGSPPARADLYYNLANARLRAAFSLIERGEINIAASNVRLAKDSYRKALNLNPHYWSAKYNLDVAMRLVRDFPQMEAEVLEEPPRETPKRLWTELPRKPRGLP